MTGNDLNNLLKQFKIPFASAQHPAVFTCEEANLHTSELAGARTKNLFLRNRKGDQHYLLVVSESKKVNINKLGEVTDSGRLSFASADRLDRFLGIAAGSVSILALYNDKNKDVQLWIDRDLKQFDEIQAHPLVNTETLVLGWELVDKFLDYTGHTPLFIEVPLDE